MSFFTDTSLQVRLYSVPLKHSSAITGLVFLICLVAYLITLSGQVGFEDAGLFSTVCYFNGVPHPPGYPLYALLCSPFAHLPGLSPAHGVALFSALCAACSSALITLISTKLTGNLIVSIGAGLIYGLSLSFWSQAIIQEVYTLHVLLFFTAVFLCIIFIKSTNLSLKKWFALCLTIGLGLSNHWPLFVLSGFIFPCLLFIRARHFFRWLWGKPLLVGWVGLLIGLMPYLYLWMRSRSNPFINFYEPFKHWSDLFFFINRSGYAGVDNAGGNWEDKKAFLIWFSQSLGDQVTWVWGLLAALSLIWLIPKRPLFLIGLLTSMLGCSIALILLLNFQFNEQSRAVFHVYPLVAWGGVALLGAMGLHHLTHRLTTIKPIINLGLVAACTLYLATTNGQANYRPTETFADQFAKAVLDSLDPNAIFITYADFSLPILYKNLAEKYRPDVTLYNSQSLILSNRLTSANSTTKEKQQAYQLFIQTTNRPVYYFLCTACPFGYEDYGLLKKATPENPTSLTVLPNMLKLLTSMKTEERNDLWSNAVQQQFANAQARLLFQLPDHHPDHQALWEALSLSAVGRLALANEWINNPSNPQYYKQLLTYLKQDTTLLNRKSAFQQATFYGVLGKLLALNPGANNFNHAFDAFNQGIELYPFFDNPALLGSFELTLQLNRADQSKAFIQAHPQLTNISKIYKKLSTNHVKSDTKTIKKLLKDINQLLQTQVLSSSLTQNIQQLQQLEPNSNRTKFLTGAYYTLTSNFDQALPLFLSVLEQEPNHFGALLNAVQIYRVKQQWPELQALLQRAYLLSPQNPIVQNIKQELQNTPWAIKNTTATNKQG